ncbi:unnamed protein product [Amoebophrya sp. A120]|nr:unnamed protein product [Amoebophrya sp. A120]|eukprot:GSA120T00023339001.1
MMTTLAPVISCAGFRPRAVRFLLCTFLLQLLPPHYAISLGMKLKHRSYQPILPISVRTRDGRRPPAGAPPVQHIMASSAMIAAQASNFGATSTTSASSAAGVLGAFNSVGGPPPASNLQRSLPFDRLEPPRSVQLPSSPDAATSSSTRGTVSDGPAAPLNAGATSTSSHLTGNSGSEGNNDSDTDDRDSDNSGSMSSRSSSGISTVSESEDSEDDEDSLGNDLTPEQVRADLRPTTTTPPDAQHRCFVCLEDDKDRPLLRFCGRCNARCHSDCWQEHRATKVHVSGIYRDSPYEVGSAVKCPLCRGMLLGVAREKVALLFPHDLCTNQIAATAVLNWYTPPPRNGRRPPSEPWEEMLLAILLGSSEPERIYPMRGSKRYKELSNILYRREAAEDLPWLRKLFKKYNSAVHEPRDTSRTARRHQHQREATVWKVRRCNERILQRWFEKKQREKEERQNRSLLNYARTIAVSSVDLDDDERSNDDDVEGGNYTGSSSSIKLGRPAANKRSCLHPVAKFFSTSMRTSTAPDHGQNSRAGEQESKSSDHVRHCARFSTLLARNLAQNCWTLTDSCCCCGDSSARNDPKQLFNRGQDFLHRTMPHAAVHACDRNCECAGFCLVLGVAGTATAASYATEQMDCVSCCFSATGLSCAGLLAPRILCYACYWGHQCGAFTGEDCARCVNASSWSWLRTAYNTICCTKNPQLRLPTVREERKAFEKEQRTREKEHDLSRLLQIDYPLSMRRRDCLQRLDGCEFAPCCCCPQVGLCCLDAWEEATKAAG